MPLRKDAAQGAMDDKVGVAPDRTGEVRVIDLGEPVVSDRVFRIDGTAQALEQGDLEAVFLEFSANVAEQLLKFLAVGDVADAVAEGARLFRELPEFRRIGILVTR